MSLQRTLAIIKPDAFGAGHAGGILTLIEEAGLKVVAMRMRLLTEAEAKGFYAVHAERSFYPELVAFMTSGPVVTMVLEGDDAIRRWRDLMGPTDSTKAPPGTVRGRYGKTIQRNAVHGSDAPETARFEIGYLFPEL
jgi:nucleoside-diphosphate kinase